jgi:hypothetical protein
MHTIGPMLKGQDLLVAMKLAANVGAPWTFATLGGALGMSPSEARYALQRAAKSELVSIRTRSSILPSLLEFLIHGVRYAFPAERGRRVRGMPTADSAVPLSEHLAANPDGQMVWRYAEGTTRGESVSPIYESVPVAAMRDHKLYRLLALLDGIRVGGPRVRALAQDLLAKELR